MPESSHRIAIKRAYDPPVAGDGVRVLVDRLWPRGVIKRRAASRGRRAPNAKVRGGS